MSERQCTYSVCTVKPLGFSLVELIVVIAFIGIISAIATPSFLEWRDNLQFRDAAKSLTAFIRSARSEAIAKNRQYRVQVNLVARTYQLQRGNSALGSTVWDAATQQATITAIRTGLAGNNTDIICNPNGTMEFSPLGGSPTRITIFDNQISAVADLNSQRYRIELLNTGRIRIAKVSVADGNP
jgi:type II secretion system protein H